MKLQDDLVKHGCLTGDRPTNDEGWKILFPDGLDNKKSITELKVTKAFKASKTERSKSNPLWKSGMNDIDIFTSVQQLFPVLGQSRVKINLDRRHAKSAVRALVVMSVPYNSESANRPRDWAPICAWAIAEFAYVKLYRQELLQGPAGAVRLSISNIFDKFARTPTQTIIGPSGRLATDTHFAWCDQLVVQDPDEVLKMTHEIDAGNATSRLSEQENILNMQNEIQRITAIWENSALCCNSMGGDNEINKDISDVLGKLIHVCHYIVISAIFVTMILDDGDQRC